MSMTDPLPGRILPWTWRARRRCWHGVFHFVYDLELFGWVAPGNGADGGLADAGPATAGSFLFLAGLSLWLGHGAGIRWRGFWRRFVLVAGAAAVITVATWVALGEGFIFFGILHAIAAASLLGLLVLRVPAVPLVALAALAFWAPSFARAEVFDPWWFWWTGLQTVRCARSITCRWRPGSGRSCWGWRWAGWGADGPLVAAGGLARWPHGRSGWRCRGASRSGSTWRISRC
jgi:hypothetical protein